MLGKVLAVAIDRYPSHPLNGCLNDGEDLYKTLVKSVGYDPRHIRYLANDVATKENILAGLSWVAEADFAFCFYAGHGSLDNSGLHPILVPYDFEKWWSSPLSDADIEKCIGGMNGVMIYDCCHSGSLCTSDLDNSTRSLEQSDCRERFMPNPNHPVFLDMSETADQEIGGRDVGETRSDLHLHENHFIYISGCRDSETSEEARVDGMSRGLFSSSFCRLFRENPACSTRDLWNKTSAAIQERVDRLKLTPQHPQLWCRADLLDQPLFGEIQ